MKRSIVWALLTGALLIAPFAHAQSVLIGDPYTDTVQLWTGIIGAVEAFAHDLAGALAHSEVQQVATHKNSHSPKELPAALTASAVLATNPVPQYASSTKPAQPLAATDSGEQSRSPPALEQQIYRISGAPALDASAFVTQDELQAQLQQLSATLLAKIDTPAASIPQSVAADGNPWVPYAASNNISNLSNVTITNANLIASEIPALDYLSLGGGTLTGTLDVPTLNASSTSYGVITATDSSTTDATSTNLFASVADFTTGLVNALSGTTLNYTAASTTNLSVEGTAYFGGTATSTFSSNGALSLVANGLTVGTSQLTVSGGNVGIGTTTPWSDIANASSLLDLTTNGIVRITLHDTATSQEEKLSSDGTGFYIDSAGAASASNNNIVFRVSNTNSNYATFEAGRFTSAGLFGVGTTSPWAQLSASSSSANPALAVQQNSTGASAVFLGGDVGIGTTSPSSQLSVADNVTTTGPQLVTNGTFNGSAAGWNLGSTVAYGTNDIISTYGPVLGSTLYGGVNDSGDASTTFQTVSGDTYLLTFTVSSDTGPMWVYLTHDTLTSSAIGMQGPFGNGTHTVAFQTNFTGTETINFSYWDGAPWNDLMFGNASGETWTLSNVSIKQTVTLSPTLSVTGYDGSTWLSLGNDLGGNTALGQHALITDLNNTASYYNTAIGANALYNSTTGGENTGVGWDALYSNTTGTYDTAVGPDALFENTTGGSNTAIGLWTLYNNTTGYDNTGDGGFALFSNTTGHYNTADGLYALAHNTTGANDVAAGVQALYFNRSATSTVAIGAYAGYGGSDYSNQGGTVVGYQAGFNFATSSDYNTLLGYQAGYGITTGKNNIWIGAATSSTSIANLTTGSQNILIGNNISLPSATANGQLDIGNSIYGTGVTGTGSTVSSGSIGIASTTPWARLSVAGPDTLSTTPALAIGNSSNSPLFNVMDNGFIGIGTTSPQTNVDMEFNGGGGIYVESFRNSTLGGNIELLHSRGTLGAGSSLNVNDQGGNIYLDGIDSNGLDQILGDISSVYNGNGGSKAYGSLVFSINSTPDKQLVIQGNVGGGSDFGFGGTPSANTGIDMLSSQSVYASGGAAYGILVNTNIQATTTNDALDVLYLNPTFTNNGQTGVTHNGLLVASGMNSGFGTIHPYSSLQVTGPDTASTSAFAVVNSASTTVFAVFDSGNSTYSGSIFQSSDQRLKTDVQSLDASSSLGAIEQLNPVSYFRIDQPGTNENLGFIAQAVQQIFPELVSTTSPTALTPGGTLTLNYEGLIAPIVSAIQSIANITGTFEQNLIAWLGDASNGIGDFFAENGHFSNELCVGSTCVTAAQFQAMAAAANASQSSGQGSGDLSADDTEATDTPPIIQINGDNPAVIQVGDVYNDLGATITGPQADLNLGITTYVNGIETSPLQIDTSQAATDSVDYVVTDQNGLTSTTTRTVIIQPVEAPSIVPPDDAGVGDTASSTPASSSATTTATTTSS